MAANNFRYLGITPVFFCQPLKLFLSRLTVLDDRSLKFPLALVAQASIEFAGKVLASVGIVYEYQNIFRNWIRGLCGARYHQARG